jgi:hypothetical protein
MFESQHRWWLWPLYSNIRTFQTRLMPWPNTIRRIWSTSFSRKADRKGCAQTCGRIHGRPHVQRDTVERTEGSRHYSCGGTSNRPWRNWTFVLWWSQERQVKVHSHEGRGATYETGFMFMSQRAIACLGQSFAHCIPWHRQPPIPYNLLDIVLILENPPTSHRMKKRTAVLLILILNFAL